MSATSESPIGALLARAREQVGSIADKSLREKLIADLADALEASECKLRRIRACEWEDLNGLFAIIDGGR